MDFIIKTDLTTEGTEIQMDGKSMADNEKISSITFYADAPNKKYEDDGWISLSIQTFDEEGNVKRTNYGKDKKINENIKPLGLMDDATYTKTDVIRFLGDELDTDLVTLVDSIISESEKQKIACPKRDVLLNRSISSLKDKATDLGITSEDA